MKIAAHSTLQPVGRVVAVVALAEPEDEVEGGDGESAGFGPNHTARQG